MRASCPKGIDDDTRDARNKIPHPMYIARDGMGSNKEDAKEIWRESLRHRHGRRKKKLKGRDQDVVHGLHVVYESAADMHDLFGSES